MAKSEKVWIYERKAMAKQANAILGYRVPIRDIPEEQFGDCYLTKDPAIYIKYKNNIVKGLDDAKARAVRFGFFAEALCSLNFTDFEYIETVADELEPWEQTFSKQMANLLERPVLANMAPVFIGGYLLQSMKYCIKRRYDTSGKIEENEDPLMQILTAINHFCDMGLLKGHFTDKTAQNIFYRILPDMYKITTEGDARKRIDMSMKVIQEMKPLWEDRMKEAYEKGKAEEEMLKELGLSSGMGSGSGTDLDAEEMADLADLTKGAMRKTTFEEIEELEEEGTLASEEEEKSSGRDTGAVEDDETTEKFYSGEIDLSGPNDYDPEEYEMEVEGMDFLDRLVQAEIEIDAAKASSGEKEVPDFKEVEKKYKLREYKCKNRFPSLRNPESSERAYNRVVKANMGRINTCYKKMKKLFAEEAEEVVYRSSGKLDLERTMESTVTSKLFTKTVEPKDKSNMAVMIAIDESGSMYGSRIERAKGAAINLAEIFGKLGIPCYIMGFTADTDGAKAVHDHFTTWENKKEDRIKLTSISADSNNFDGYSIRYASSILSMRPETHKVLLVISDGQPACSVYDYGAGYRDTKDAIREARSADQVVLGIAIGADVDVLHQMYGSDFIFIETGEDLFTGIMKKFTAMVKKW